IRDPLVTGVQTCALPISAWIENADDVRGGAVLRSPAHASDIAPRKATCAPRMRRAVIGISMLQLSCEHAHSNGGRQAIPSARNDSYLFYFDRPAADQERHLALLRRLIERGHGGAKQLVD